MILFRAFSLPHSCMFSNQCLFHVPQRFLKYSPPHFGLSCMGSSHLSELLHLYAPSFALKSNNPTPVSRFKPEGDDVRQPSVETAHHWIHFNKPMLKIHIWAEPLVFYHARLTLTDIDWLEFDFNSLCFSLLWKLTLCWLIYPVKPFDQSMVGFKCAVEINFYLKYFFNWNQNSSLGLSAAFWL